MDTNNTCSIYILRWWMAYTSPQWEQRLWHLEENRNRKCRRWSAQRKVATLMVNINKNKISRTNYLSCVLSRNNFTTA